MSLTLTHGNGNLTHCCHTHVGVDFFALESEIEISQTKALFDLEEVCELYFHEFHICSYSQRALHATRVKMISKTRKKAELQFE